MKHSKSSQIDYNKIWSIIEETASSPEFYWQSLSIIGCFIFSYFFYNIIKKFFLGKAATKIAGKNLELNHLYTKYISPLIYPLFSVIFISLGYSIYSQFFKETILFSTTLKLMSLFIFLRFLRISSNNNFIANTTGLLLMPALILSIFGLLQPTIEYLDQYALEIGHVRISVYLSLKALVVLILVLWLSNLIRKKSKYYIDANKNIKSTTKNIINKIIDITVYAIVIVILFKIFGVDMTTVAVIGGAVGVGIGFGLQKIASNFISGMILLFEKSIEIGDVVEIENENIIGTVKYFGGRYTLIECFDGKEIMIPNEDFIINKVINWTYSNSRARIEVNIGVSYKSDLEKVKELLIAAAKEHPRCLDYPEIDCFVNNFGDFSVDFLLFFWVSDMTAGRLSPKSDVMMNIWKKFKENGIEIPFPQREVKFLNER